jgi:hypothetical protein
MDTGRYAEENDIIKKFSAAIIGPDIGPDTDPPR